MSQENKVTIFVYDAKDSQLFRIWGINLFIKIVTLGIYSFWGKTRMRRYITGSFSLLNDRFEYTGTGLEAFLGFIKALPIIIILFAPVVIFDPKEVPAVNLMFIPTILLVEAGMYAGMRYRYSRTNWRGIRGQLTGSALQYAGLKLGRNLANAVTIGIAIPYSDIIIQQYKADHTYFGSSKVKFNGNARKLLGIHLVTLLLAIPTLGLSRLWYRAALARHICESTTINNISFRGSHTGANMLGLLAGNLLLFVLTLGFGMPIIIQRSMRYFADNIAIIGDIETAGIYQSNEELGKSGEGIDGILGEQDIGFL